MGKIVVGVDGSDGSREALRWAFVEATLRGTALEVVTVWQYPITASLPTFGAMSTPDDFETNARSSLLSILADEGITAAAPIPVSTLVAEGNAARTHFSMPPAMLTFSLWVHGDMVASPAFSSAQSANNVCTTQPARSWLFTRTDEDA